MNHLAKSLLGLCSGAFVWLATLHLGAGLGFCDEPPPGLPPGEAILDDGRSRLWTRIRSEGEFLQSLVERKESNWLWVPALLCMLRNSGYPEFLFNDEWDQIESNNYAALEILHKLGPAETIYLCQGGLKPGSGMQPEIMRGFLMSVEDGPQMRNLRAFLRDEDPDIVSDAIASVRSRRLAGVIDALIPLLVDDREFYIDSGYQLKIQDEARDAAYKLCVPEPRFGEIVPAYDIDAIVTLLQNLSRHSPAVRAAGWRVFEKAVRSSQSDAQMLADKRVAACIQAGLKDPHKLVRAIVCSLSK